MSNISVFGSTGFIGKKWMSLYEDISIAEPRESINPICKNILYLRSTNSNYNVLKDASIDIRSNLLLLTETLNNLKKNSNFLLTSSWFVYGKNNIHINNEESPCNPTGFYSITKYTQEQLLKSFCETKDINYKIVRLCNVIGGDNGASAQKNALEFLINKLKNDEDINIYDGDNYRNYMHVEDVCIAIKLIFEKGCEHIYNIGNSESVKLMDIVTFCKNLIDSKSKISIIQTPTFHKNVQVKDFHMETTKLASLNFKPKYSLEETLKFLCLK
jgi:nucleoside-diphosphate-sugar epimerase